jgi:nitrogen regulatory protein P-II 2
MHTVNIKLVTIISEPVLVSSLISLTRSLGASGFTVTDVRGEGSAKKHGGEVPDAKVKIEIVADATLAERIMAEIAKGYFENYSMIVYATAIAVIRSEKF